ncbi:hypothetical protein D7I39_11295 [Allopusillimonas ginsengisoli]|nr:hypothetical protein D7I39_11295 [Allopusillimonas ginsengisoli]
MLEHVPEHEWRKLHQAKIEAEGIIDRMTQIVSGLSSVFADGKVPAEIGASFTERHNSAFGRIYTPFGAGRFAFGWIVKDALCGHLVAEREDIDVHEKIVWKPALGVTVPASGVPYVGDGEDRLQIFLGHQLGSRRDNSLFALGMSILYAFAQVPKA